MPTTTITAPSLARTSALERCQAFIVHQLHAAQPPPGLKAALQPGPAITIAHQTGSGAHEIATRLAALLQMIEPPDRAPWTVFDRNLIEQVLHEHHLPDSLARLLPEEDRSYLRDIMEDILGRRPPSWVMVPEIAETVLHLAHAGHVIIVGRGANFITRRLPRVFHLRIVASPNRRAERIQQLRRCTIEEATDYIHHEDRSRRRYAQQHFHHRPDDDLLYHVVVNTDLIPCADAAGMIAGAAERRFASGPTSRPAL